MSDRNVVERQTKIITARDQINAALFVDWDYAARQG